MVRPLRTEFAGAIYHVMSRGNSRQDIYLDDGDCVVFLATLQQVVGRFDWRCHAYCLMRNHYHLLLETLRPNLGRGMRQLNGLYAQRFNRRYDRTGHLLQGRYNAVLVERDPHLLELCRYVVLNPVRAGLCPAPEDWPWSSYRATAGVQRAPSLLEVDWVLSQFGPDREGAERAYRDFVAGGIGRDPWSGITGRRYLGSTAYVRETSLRVPRSPEVARVEWQPLRPSLERLFDDHGDAAPAVAYRQYGYRLREIAEHLRVHYSTVSRMLRMAEARGYGIARPDPDA